jgi:uncharacterized membrane protein
MAAQQSQLPPHVEETIASIARVHAAQSQETSSLRLRIVVLTRALGRPVFVVAIAVAIVAWIAGNLAVSNAGGHPLDVPPFPWLAGVVSSLGLLMTILVLSTQQRDDEIGEHREKLTLQLAVLADQRLAKIVSLLEDLRRDDPHIADRADSQADAMSVPTDPHAVSKAIRTMDADEDTRAGRTPT